MARQSRQQDAVVAGESSADEEQHQQGSSESVEEEDDMIRVGEKMLQAVCCYPWTLMSAMKRPNNV